MFQLLLHTDTLMHTYTQYSMEYIEASRLGQAKLIHSLSSGLSEKSMRAGGHFSYFIF